MIIKTTTSKNERVAIFSNHIVAVFSNTDGTAAVSLSNGEMLDLADTYSTIINKCSTMIGRESKGPLVDKLNKESVMSWLRPKDL